MICLSFVSLGYQLLRSFVFKRHAFYNSFLSLLQQMREYNALFDWLEKFKLTIYIDNFVNGGFDMTSVCGITAEVRSLGYGNVCTLSCAVAKWRWHCISTQVIRDRVTPLLHLPL